MGRQEIENEISLRERQLDVARQCAYEAAATVRALRRLPEAFTRNRLVGSLGNAEALLMNAQQRFTGAAEAVREAWAARGGTVPEVAPLSCDEAPEDSSVVSELERQFELSRTVAAVEAAKTSFASHLEQSTRAVAEQLLRRKEPIPVEPVTLRERIDAAERRINLSRCEIDAIEEQLRPFRRWRDSSELAKLKFDRSIDIQFVEQSLREKNEKHAGLLVEHKNLLTEERRAQRAVAASFGTQRQNPCP